MMGPQVTHKATKRYMGLRANTLLHFILNIIYSKSLYKIQYRNANFMIDFYGLGPDTGGGADVVQKEIVLENISGKMVPSRLGGFGRAARKDYRSRMSRDLLGS